MAGHIKPRDILSRANNNARIGRGSIRFGATRTPRVKHLWGHGPQDLARVRWHQHVYRAQEPVVLTWTQCTDGHRRVRIENPTRRFGK